MDVAEYLAQERYGQSMKDLPPAEHQAVMAGVPEALKKNRYNAQTKTLTFTAPGKTNPLPYKWVFYFLMAVGFWNFVGAGIFGFLINLPVVSYFEIGTILTPSHGHAALMGVFGMEAVALMVLGFRQALTDEQWKRPEKFIRISFQKLLDPSVISFRMCRPLTSNLTNDKPMQTGSLLLSISNA